MANTVRIKRRAAGGSTGAPTTLKNAELAFNESDSGGGVLYYGFGADGSGDATSIIAIAGAGAYVNITGTQTISGDKTFTGALNISGATVDGMTTTGDVTVGGNLTVEGTTTTVDSVTVVVADKNIELGSVDTPTDATADGGGITLKGTTDKTIAWVDTTDAWTFSEHVDLASGKEYRINGTTVLTGTTLGSGVVNSSLTSVGTIATGTWQGTTIGASYGGTGFAGGYSNGQLLIGKADGSLGRATLTGGTGVTITNGDGTITIDANDQQTAGDGIDIDGSGVISADLKANGGLVIESTELAVDLGASAITGTLSEGDGGTGETTYSQGELLIGNSLGGLTRANLTGGNGVEVVNGDGSATIQLDLLANGGLVFSGVNNELAVDLNASGLTGTLQIGDGGTGATTAAGARTNLGLEIGTDVQAWDADLDTLSGMQTGAAGALALLTQTELEILDGALVTTGELNVLDGNTAATATTLAVTDRFVVNDAGTMVQVALSDLVTFLEDGTTSGFDIDGGTF